MKIAVATAPGEPTVKRDASSDELAERNALNTKAATEKARYEREDKYKDMRRNEYPDVGDQLDAIWMELNSRRLNGEKLVQDADNMLGQILAVKQRHPKPVKE